MAIDLIKILPEYFRPVLEFKEIIKADEAVLAELETNIEQIRKNFYIQTADQATLTQKEVLLIYSHRQERQSSTAGRGYFKNIIRLSPFPLTF